MLSISNLQSALRFRDYTILSVDGSRNNHQRETANKKTGLLTRQETLTVACPLPSDAATGGSYMACIAWQSDSSIFHIAAAAATTVKNIAKASAAYLKCRQERRFERILY